LHHRNDLPAILSCDGKDVAQTFERGVDFCRIANPYRQRLTAL
jgi:hypothetical protein